MDWWTVAAAGTADAATMIQVLKLLTLEKYSAFKILEGPSHSHRKCGGYHKILNELAIHVLASVIK